MIKEEKQKGVILYIVLLIISIFMSIVLTLSSISVSQTKIAWQAGDSVKAFGAADTGVEQALYNIRINDNFNDILLTNLSNGASYSASTTNTQTTATIESKGIFRKTRRVIEVKY